jgi:hypothetical protein
VNAHSGDCKRSATKDKILAYLWLAAGVEISLGVAELFAQCQTCCCKAQHQNTKRSKLSLLNFGGCSMLRLRHASARLLLQPIPSPLLDARRWLTKDSKDSAHNPSSKQQQQQQQQQPVRHEARKIKPDFAAAAAAKSASANTASSTRRHNIMFCCVSRLQRCSARDAGVMLFLL